MFSKSLIQFSIDGRGYVPSLFLYLRPNYGGGDEDNGTSFSRSRACTAALSAPNPAAAHHQQTPLPETPGHSPASLGQSLEESLLLSPGSWCAQGSVCALQESVSQSCVSSGGSMVGLIDLPQEGLCHTQVCCTQSLCPCSSPLLTYTSTGGTQTQF